MEILPVPCHYILSLMNWLLIIMKFSQKNSSVHNINARHKHHLHGPNANLSCFQKSTFSAGIKMFNNLLPSVTILKNDKAKFKAAFRKYLHTHSFYCVYKFLICKDDLWYWFCKMFSVFYTVNLYMFVLWLVPRPAVFMIH